MARRAAISLAALLAACSAPQVLREGPGWRELKVSDTQTRLELTASDPAALADVARTHPDAPLRGQAVDRLRDPAVLAEVARRDAAADVRRRAVARIADRAVLSEVAQADADPGVRALAAERRDLLRGLGPRHPEYAAWASRAPGAFVRFRAELRVNASTTAVDVLRTLVSAGPEGVVVEQRNAATGKALEGAVKALLERADAPAGRRVEGEESLEVQGRRLDCTTTHVSGQFGAVIARVKVWRNEAVPGGVVRVDVEESPQGEPLRSLRAVAVQW